MGFRTLVLINNDHDNLLLDDPNVGNRIHEAVNGYNLRHSGDLGRLGHVVEQAHADVVRLAIIGEDGSLDVNTIATTYSDNPDQRLVLLQTFADQMGYALKKLNY
jgi:hypothetical protein